MGILANYSNFILGIVVGIFVVIAWLVIDGMLYHRRRPMMYLIKQLCFENGEKSATASQDNESLAPHMTAMYKRMALHLQMQAGTLDYLALILAAPNTKFELDNMVSQEVITTKIELVSAGTWWRRPEYRVTADFDLLADEPIDNQVFYVITHGTGGYRIDYLVAKLDVHYYVHPGMMIPQLVEQMQRVKVSEQEPISNYRLLSTTQIDELGQLTYPDGSGLNLNLNVLRKDTRLIAAQYE